MPFLVEARFLRAWEQLRLGLPHSQAPSMLFYCKVAWAQCFYGWLDVPMLINHIASLKEG